uniref:CASP-like protein n=1 Tax=Macrostomum lignano TaxID=282301 RepID=A0A1I8HBJ6_9PLAT
MQFNLTATSIAFFTFLALLLSIASPCFTIWPKTKFNAMTALTVIACLSLVVAAAADVAALVLGAARSRPVILSASVSVLIAVLCYIILLAVFASSYIDSCDCVNSVARGPWLDAIAMSFAGATLPYRFVGI